MTDRSKFEQMLEYLISEEQDKAREIFHQLVVEKSREIYEQILAEDFETVEEEDEHPEEEEEDFIDEADDEESDGEDDVEEPEGDEDDGDVGGDATDDFLGDIDSDDSEDTDGAEGDGDLEDRVMDLEDALDDLRAEFEQMMGDDEMGMGDDEMGDMGGMGDDEMGMDDMGAGLDMKEPMKDSFDVSDNFMREYIEKVSSPKHGDDGVNTKSIVAGKNDMGGTTANIVKGGTGEVAEAGAGGTIKGNGVMKQKVQDNPDAKGNVNVPGGSAGVKHLKKQPTYPNGLGKESGADTKSPLNGAPKRAK